MLGGLVMGSLLLVLSLLAVVVAWQGLLLIALGRRVVSLEERLSGEAIVPLSYAVGDAVPGELAGTSMDARPRSLSLRNGRWLVLFATAGCSACGRAALAATHAAVSAGIQSVIIMPEAEGDPSLGTAGWLSEAQPQVLSAIVLIPLAQWMGWGPQGTPTAILVQDGILRDIATGLTDAPSLGHFVESPHDDHDFATSE